MISNTHVSFSLTSFCFRLAKSSSGVIVSIPKDTNLKANMSYTAFLDMISTMLPLECVINSTGTFCFSLFFLNNTLVLTDIYINIGP